MVRRIQDESTIRRIAVGPVKRVSVAPVVRSPALVAGAAVLLIGVLSWPVVFSKATFNVDCMGQV